MPNGVTFPNLFQIWLSFCFAARSYLIALNLNIAKKWSTPIVAHISLVYSLRYWCIRSNINLDLWKC